MSFTQLDQSFIDNLPWPYENYLHLTAFYNRYAEWLTDYRPVKGLSLKMQLCAYKEHLAMKEQFYRFNNYFLSQFYNYQKYYLSHYIIARISPFEEYTYSDLFSSVFRYSLRFKRLSNKYLGLNPRDSTGFRLATYFCVQNYIMQIILPMYRT